MWMALWAIGLLTILAVLGSFRGAENAKLFFNSIPLAVYWIGLAVLLIAGFIAFPRLLHKPGPLMIHAGCLLVVAGGMWGSQAGHKFAGLLFGTQKIPNGYMIISEGDSTSHVTTRDFDRHLGELPFSVKLKDFRVEYYEPDRQFVPRLNIKTHDGREFQYPVKVGEEISLGPENGKLKIVRIFKNFKIRIENGKKIVVDEGDEAENPAVKIEIEVPDGNSFTRYVFERFDSNHPHDKLQLSFLSHEPQIIRDYFSDVAIIVDGKEVTGKSIEVNKPLHYGGYHFYQHSYDSQEHRYTILSVTSDSGLYVVYSGYWLLSLGMLWHFWLGPIAGYIKNNKR